MLTRLIAPLLLLLTVGAHAQPAPELVKPGSLTYGVAATFAPFEYQQDGAYVGFDIEFGAAIAQHMKLTPVIAN
jgi:polar amino acid transport system substrate-binding protein